MRVGSEGLCFRESCWQGGEALLSMLHKSWLGRELSILPSALPAEQSRLLMGVLIRREMQGRISIE